MVGDCAFRLVLVLRVVGQSAEQKRKNQDLVANAIRGSIAWLTTVAVNFLIFSM